MAGYFYYFKKNCRDSPLAFFVVLYAAAFSSDLAAQSMDYGSLEELFGEPVTTSVTGSPQRVSSVPATMEIITTERIRRSGATSVPELLEAVTGVDVTRWTDSHSDVAIRGYNKAFSSRLLVLLNGRQVYADHYGYTPWLGLPVELNEIQQIEIVKGPSSALFGFNAVSGVINIITLNPQYEDSDYLKLKTGTQQYEQLSIGKHFSPFENLSARISAGIKKSADFNTPLSPMESVIRAGNERKSMLVDIHYRLNTKVILEFEASRVLTTQASMGPAYSFAYERMEIQSLKSTLHLDTKLGLSEAEIYRNWIDNRVFIPQLNGEIYSLGEMPFSTYDNQVTALLFSHVLKPASKHTIRLGAEHRESELPTSPLAIATVSTTTNAISAMWEWQLDPTLTYTLAIRNDRLDLHRVGGVPENFPYTNEDWDRSSQTDSYNTALVWQSSSSNTLRLMAGRGAQLPNLYNLGGSLAAYPVPPEFQPPANIFFTGLPTLESTTVTNYELSWERRLDFIPATSKLAYFSGTSKKIIADSGYTDFSSGVFSAPANIGNSETDGIEIGLESTSSSSSPWRWGLGYIYQDVDDNFQEIYPDWLTFANYEATNIPHMVTAHLGWSSNRVEMDFYLRYKDLKNGIRAYENYFIDLANPDIVPVITNPLSSFVNADININYTVSKNILLSLSGRNILKASQEQSSGPKIERQIFGSFKFDF